MWTTKQMNNPPLKKRRFGCKIYELLLSPREFELIQRTSFFAFLLVQKVHLTTGATLWETSD